MDDMKILYLPGEEPQELKALLGEFFSRLNALWPNKTIVWADWDHAALDRPAARLCTALGYYPHGARFLTAYGYSILTDKGLIEADGGKEKSGISTADSAEDKPRNAQATVTDTPTAAENGIKPVREPVPAGESTAEPSVPEKLSAAEQSTPAPSVPTADTSAQTEKKAFRTGKIVCVLPYGNSGFVRDDETGLDHYFNVRSFTHWVDELRIGLAVRYRLEPHFEQKRNAYRDNAVELSCLHHQGIPGMNSAI